MWPFHEERSGTDGGGGPLQLNQSAAFDHQAEQLTTHALLLSTLRCCLQGDSIALQSAMSALVDCLGRDEGCKVVPGLPQEQYIATLACSIAGGLVAGFVSKIEPQGE